MAGPSRRRREENPALEGYFRHGRGDAGSGESADRHAGFPGKGAEKRGKSAGFFRSFSTAAHRLPEGDRCSVRVGGVGSEEAVFHSFPVDGSSFGKPGVCRGIRRRAESLSICGAKVEVSSKRGAAGWLSGRFPQGPVGRNCRSAGGCEGVKAAFRRNPARSATDGARFPQKFSTGCGNIGGKTKRISRGFVRAKPAAEGVWERFGKVGDFFLLCRSFCMRTNVCGDVHAESIVFFACAAGGQEGSPVSRGETDRPSCQSPLPEAQFLASGLHPSNVHTLSFLSALLNGILPVLFCDKRVYRKTARMINRAFTMLSGSVSFMARSTPRMQLFVSGLSTPSRQGVHSELSGLDRAFARCTFAGTSLTRKIAPSALSVLVTFSAS